MIIDTMLLEKTVVVVMTKDDCKYVRAQNDGHG